MNWFRNMTVTGKLISGFSAVVALTICLGIFAIIQMARVNRTGTQMGDIWVPSIRTTGDLAASFLRFRLTEYRHVYSTNQAELVKVEESLATYKAEFDKSKADYEQLVHTPEVKKLFAAFDESWDRYLKVHQQLVTLGRNGEGDKARVLVRGDSLDRYAEVRDAINAIVEHNMAAVEAANTTGNELYSMSRALLITVMLCCAALGMGIAFVIGRMISNPLASVVTRAEEIAGGDLTGKDIEVKSKDEIGQLTTSVNKMSHALQTLITEVTSATNEVAGAATEIAASSEQMAAGMTQQSDQVSQISSAVEQMNASVVEVARKSSDAASNASEAGSVADEGGRVVGSTIEGMHSIREAVKSSADSVTMLGRRGEQIGEIIEVINDIADQTNLLALNAAIEAARAGEHGRGFAVVADEVRKLADRTTKATKEIAESITAIQDETTQAVDRMNTGTEEVKTGVDRATAAGESLKQIVQQASTVAQMVQSIAAAAEEQSAASEQITHSIETISAVTRQSSEGASQAATAATQLSIKSEQLKQLVAQFRVSSDTRVAQEMAA
ncbi:MAG: methyl-accepting chemotaxis protein [Phycisphaeraceae bacterium JB051]